MRQVDSLGENQETLAVFKAVGFLELNLFQFNLFPGRPMWSDDSL